MDLEQFKGVIPALLTPVKNGEIDYQAMEVHLNYLITKGVRGVYITGSSGEGFLLSDQERMNFVTAVCKYAAKRISVIAHTGSIATKSAIQFSVAAAESGADAVSSVPPFYYKFSSEEILDYYKDLAQATSLPLFVYNIPATTNINLSIAELAELFQVPNIVGLKYTSVDMFTMEQIKQLDSKPIVFAGADEMSFYGLWAGADAIVGSSYNLTADNAAAMIEKFYQKDFAGAHLEYQLGCGILACLLKFPYFAALRKVLEWESCSIGNPRKPFKSLSREQENTLRIQLQEVVARYPHATTSLRNTL